MIKRPLRKYQKRNQATRKRGNINFSLNKNSTHIFSSSSKSKEPIKSSTGKDGKWEIEKIINRIRIEFKLKLVGKGIFVKSELKFKGDAQRETT